MKTKHKEPEIRLHNDGNDYICMECGKIAHRTRNNPYPEIKHDKKCSGRKDEN